MIDYETAYLKFLHDKPRAWWAVFLFAVLKFLSLFFLAGWTFKRMVYRGGLRKRYRVPCPVISVGNITTGGTGKTPVVIALAKHFTAEGKRVAVLTRGYGRKGKGSAPVWVSDGKKILTTPEEGGDEPVLIAKNVPGAAVVVCKNRYRGGVEALRDFKPDLFILDDGYQRRNRFHRDLDILVVDGINPFSTGWVLPAGLLREPIRAIDDANVIIINKVNLSRSPEDIRTIIQKHNPRAYVVESCYKPLKLRDFMTGKEMKPSALDGVSVGAFSGVANPLSFIRTLADFKILIRHAYTLRDHYPYTKEKLKAILGDAKQRGLHYLVTTSKDEVKLPKNLELELPILILDIKWEVTGGKNQWETVLKTISLSCSS